MLSDNVVARRAANSDCGVERGEGLRSRPPDILVEAIDGPRLVVLRVGDDGVTLSDHVDKADSIILWARDREIYRDAVNSLKELATVRADGKPIAQFGRSTADELEGHDWVRKDNLEKLFNLTLAERARTGGKIEKPGLWHIEIISLAEAANDQSKYDERKLRTVDSQLLFMKEQSCPCVVCKQTFPLNLAGVSHVAVASHRSGELYHVQAYPICIECATETADEISSSVRQALREGRVELPLNVGPVGTA